MKKLDVKAFSLSFGITSGISIMVLGWLAITGWGIRLVDVMSSLYIGYSASFWGGIIGGIWAFVDWGIGALIIALIYNALLGQDDSEPRHHEAHQESHHETHEDIHPASPSDHETNL